ncbi:hypothetical protein BpHYR1_008688 [Brachionus plicatilis]|uniref:Uncharacterized protein n=1 Tax=Brachionus plicatilis TaxID=10195 RepID=A0A3M7RHL4_BRAPC|nr:hypothetical protein BpHYR1_008688 [Brachionus plicatilis]
MSTSISRGKKNVYVCRKADCFLKPVHCVLEKQEQIVGKVIGKLIFVFFQPLFVLNVCVIVRIVEIIWSPEAKDNNFFTYILKQLLQSCLPKPILSSVVQIEKDAHLILD